MMHACPGTSDYERVECVEYDEQQHAEALTEAR